ncbi:hypothetical protein ACFPIJ_07945 [Dactylosporangium cerinum]|uniref:N-acetyltransferase domain-containing protein n=1 Tax=Dactylosporangium cerinum TaxID=1434730 RepID=A0ABV9VQC7_9ACTN
MSSGVEFVRATATDVGDVLSVLDDAAAWLAAGGVRQWPERFAADWVTPAVERGETWLVRSGGRTAGTVTLDWSDPLWSDLPGRAGYVHRMAVRPVGRRHRPRHPGLGRRTGPRPGRRGAPA